MTPSFLRDELSDFAARSQPYPYALEPLRPRLRTSANNTTGPVNALRSNTGTFQKALNGRI